MSVKFEFTLSDIDASNLIDILQNEKARVLAKGMDFIKPEMTNADRLNLNWCNSHAEYLEGLKQKVLAGNTRVE